MTALLPAQPGSIRSTQSDASEFCLSLKHHGAHAFAIEGQLGAGTSPAGCRLAPADGEHLEGDGEMERNSLPK